MAVRIRPWVWVVVAVMVVCILGVVAMAGVAFYFVSRHIETAEATPASASRQFESVKAGFAGQKPLVELDKDGDFVRANTDRPLAPNSAVPEQLHLLAFDPDEGRVVRFTLPFWVLKMKMGDTTIDLNGNRLDLDDLRLTVEDLERFGPTLIVDHQGTDGARVLVWSK